VFGNSSLLSFNPPRHIFPDRILKGWDKVADGIMGRNLEKEQILRKLELLRDGNGEKIGRVSGGRVVRSLNEGVRGVWDGFHGGGAEISGQRLVGSGERR